MKSIKHFLFTIILTSIALSSSAQGLKSFRLPNGLSVFVWEDPNATEVFGMVACNVGSKDEPETHTGLAHYLEHLLFKGTQKIGALNWDKEASIYQQIIQEYDKMAVETDPVKKSEINKGINKLTVEASKVSLTNEFSSLTAGMGGFGLNAYTSYDQTVYFNAFPAGGVYKWLELNSERLINPVFRGFQTELETVFEEFNRSENNSNSQLSRLLFESMFPNHPYSRPVLGHANHLKNPQLSVLIDFYNSWYVPQNMALILVGNIKTNEILGTIQEKFGRLENKPVPERTQYPKVEFQGRKEIKTKIGQYPQVVLAYNGAPANSEDYIALEVCTSILSNSSSTGLLDKLSIDGDMMGTEASQLSLKEQGRILVFGIPYYDPNQRRFDSNKSVERMLLKEIKKLQEGQFEDWLVNSIKGDLIRRYDLALESTQAKTELIKDAFINEQDLNVVLDYKNIVASLTTEKIKETAKKYFNENYVVLDIEKGKTKKGEDIEKPGFDPLEAPRGASSDYAKLFALQPVKYIAPKFIDFDADIQVKPVNDKSKLFYKQNKENDIFTLQLKYGIGTEKMPDLSISTSLMNNAGIMGLMKAPEVKQEFSNLGTTCYFSVNDSYLTVVMYGFEANLQESCNLLTRQILFPELDEKQLNNVMGGLYQSRLMEKETTESLSAALNDYLLYQDKSEYIDRPEFMDIYMKNIGHFTGEFQRATDYEAEIHYAGSLPFDTVYDILSKNLPLKAGEKATTSPEVKERVAYKENTIYFIADKEAKQANLYFFIEGDEYSNETDAYRAAFNQYFSGGFNGLVMQEIREYRSMAYTAHGVKYIPPITGKKTHFEGYIGTQADKVPDALKTYLGLINDMPLYPERLPEIKSYLRETALANKPNFRSLSSSIQSWRQRGYIEDPNKTLLDKFEKMTFDDIVKYYNENIKGRPIGIAIIGNPKQIDEKMLQQYGKVVKLSPSKLFGKEK